MNSLILIELISIVSFIFGLLIIIVPSFTIENFIILFFWFLSISYIGAILKKKGSKYFYISLFLFLPAIKYNSIGDIVFLFIAAYYIFYYIFQYFNEERFNFFKRDFQNKLRIILFLLVFSAIIGKLQINGKDFIPFMLIYFISTIILLRNLRHLEHNSNVDKINKNNLIFIISISILYIVLGMEKLKLFLYQGAKSIYNLVAELLSNIFYWPILYLAYGVQYIIEFLMSLINRDDLDLPDQSMENTMDFSEWTQNNPTFPLWLSRFLSIASRIILVSLIIYLTYLLFRKKVFNKKKEEMDYREEREFMNIRGKDKNKRRISLFKPKDIIEQIRYYYRKYLIKLDKKGIDIIASDTSLDINKKVENEDNEEILNGLREVYIQARYGEKEMDKAKVEEMKNFYTKFR